MASMAVEHTVAALLALALAGCGRADGAAPRGERPRLVVVVVLDQVGSWVLERHLSALDEGGFLRRSIARGRWDHRVVLDHAATLTAPGHAAIFTGASPADSGIATNQVWDPKRARIVSALDDGLAPVFDHESVSASPRALRVEGVADALREHTRGKAKVVALSLKDRGAVIPGGKRPDLALWYDDEARAFTTSRYYASRLPGWLARARAEHPVAGYFRLWQPLDRGALARAWGRDDAPGEGDWLGLGSSFPHDPRRSSDPYEAVRATPGGSAMLLDLAAECARRMQLGADEVPDLLAISVSSTDYIGHAFGPTSWEAADHLLRVDRGLDRLISSLEARGAVGVVVTADHGVAPLPEVQRATGAQAERVLDRSLVEVAERAADEASGPGDWIAAAEPPYVYLTPAAEEPAVRARVMAAILPALERVAGVGEAIDVQVARAWKSAADPLRLAVYASLPERLDGDVFIVPDRQSTFDSGMPEGFGTGHGSPWPYDREVPLIVAGPGVAHAETRTAQPQRTIVRSIAALLGVRAP
jgi:predicted AlkP superfamily pyrophosphatase or phosphodiesterase